MMSHDDLKKAVMELSGIVQPRYYEKVFKTAIEQHVVMTTLDRRGRVVVISTPS